jgi:CheY-like chemotaxis protein
VFELFTQAQRSPDRFQGGLGLGLALVKSLVALHHGSVSAHSDGLGKGSEFVVRLPRVTPQKVAQSHVAIADLSNQTGSMLQFLVVDDNEDAAQTLALLLQALGHQVAVAFTAGEGLRLGHELSPVLAILDIGLPDMDGYELARQFRVMPVLADSTLVALTGYGQAKDKEAAMQAGFDYHLVKPFAIDALMTIISTVKDKRLCGASTK